MLRPPSHRDTAVAPLREDEGSGWGTSDANAEAAPHTGAELRPQPGLGELAALIDEARGAGLDVRLDIEGEPAALPAGVDLAAYRIVQEALTNVRRHASATRVNVQVHCSDQAVRVTVADDGTGNGQATSLGGHGIIGMRERAALYGGELHAAGTTAGFTVRATLPMGAS